MALSLKYDDPALPYNHALTKARLQHLKRRFQPDPNLETKYRAVIDEYVAKGYAKKLVKEKAPTVNNITWYLPHNPVINPHHVQDSQCTSKITDSPSFRSASSSPHNASEQDDPS